MITRSGIFNTLGFWLYCDLCPRLGNKKKKINLETSHGIFEVGAKSKRLHCFKKSPKCAYCPRVGVIWMLQSQTDKNWHLNLYAIDNNDTLVLMTKDHIIPLAKGGTDALNNLITACEQCNNNKGQSLLITPPNLLM